MSFKNIVNKLREENKTISTMESCTGGGVANAITNIEGASEILKFSAVTYSNEFKIKMGVSSDIIDKYSVYSMETAYEMSKNISDFTSSTYGIGITGKLNRVDINNPYGADNIVFISIYDRENDMFYQQKVEAIKESRELNKELVLEKIEGMLENILGIDKSKELVKK
jgi:PncC family amidohydrolase